MWETASEAVMGNNTALVGFSGVFIPSNCKSDRFHAANGALHVNLTAGNLSLVMRVISGRRAQEAADGFTDV